MILAVLQEPLVPLVPQAHKEFLELLLVLVPQEPRVPWELQDHKAHPVVLLAQLVLQDRKAPREQLAQHQWYLAQLVLQDRKVLLG